MRYIAAFLLLQCAGNTSPTAADIKKVLAAVGIDSDNDRLDKLISELSGKDVNQVRSSPSSLSGPSEPFLVQLIAEGSSKLASVRFFPVVHASRLRRVF